MAATPPAAAANGASQLFDEEGEGRRAAATGAHKLFVYGTLKRGFTNYERYLGVAVAHGKARFLDTGTLASASERFRLVVRPPHIAPATCGPVLMQLPSLAQVQALAQATGEGEGLTGEVPGEIFEVDDSTLQAMDLMEGVRQGHYFKRLFPVRAGLADGAAPGGASGGPAPPRETIECIVYLFPISEELLALPGLASYEARHHALYRPLGPPREDIVALCRSLAHSHRLSSPAPCGLRALCVRLLPGQDLLRTLQAFAFEHGLQAAAVLSCVGSTGKTTLRPAGSPHPRVFTDKYEIVSLTGTLSTLGHHLHMSISDPQCHVFGGHVLEGCLVRTTAEIVIGLLEGLRFTRPVDARTGHDELSIDPCSVAADGEIEGDGKRRRTAGNADPGGSRG